MKLSIASAHISYKYDSKGNKLQETRVSLRPKRRHETSCQSKGLSIKGNAGFD